MPNPYQRYRKSVDSHAEQWYYDYTHPAEPDQGVRHYSGQSVRWTYANEIWDTFGTRASVKPVTHYQAVHQSNGPSTAWTHYNNGTIYPVSDWMPSPTVGQIQEAFGLPMVSQSAINSASDNAFQAMYQQVPTEVSLPNFLWELRELGDLLPKLGESMSRTVSDGFLNYQFGWKPFIGDLKNLGAVMSRVSDRIDYLKRTWGQTVRLGYYQTLDVGFSSNEVSWQSVLGEAFWYTVLKPVSLTAHYRAGGYLFQQLERLDGIEGTLRAASAALGLLNPAAVIWEAIPFSFVADWFGRIGGVIGRLSIAQPFSGVWDVRDVTHSVTEEHVCDVRFDVLTPTGNVSRGSGRVKQKLYRRWVGLPANATQLLGDLSLTSSQQMLATALLNSTRKH